MMTMMMMMMLIMKLMMIVIMIVCYFTRCSLLSSPATTATTIDPYPTDDQQEAGGVSSRVGTTVLLSQVMMFHFDCHILCDHHAYLRLLLPQWSRDILQADRHRYVRKKGGKRLNDDDIGAV